MLHHCIMMYISVNYTSIKLGKNTDACPLLLTPGHHRPISAILILLLWGPQPKVFLITSS